MIENERCGAGSPVLNILSMSHQRARGTLVAVVDWGTVQSAWQCSYLLV